MIGPFEQYKAAVHVTDVENHRIFSRCSLVYLLPFFVHYPLSFYTLFCFLFVPLFCIYIDVSILCISFIQ